MSYTLKDVVLTDREMSLLKSAIQSFENLCDDEESEILESIVAKINNAEWLNKTVK